MKTRPEPENKKRKWQESTETHTQNSTTESQNSADSFKDRKPAHPDEHPNPVTTKAKTNSTQSTKPTSNYMGNQPIFNIIKVNRRVRERGQKRDNIFSLA